MSSSEVPLRIEAKPRCWYEGLSNYLTRLDFKFCTSEPCVFFRWRGSDLTIITVYMDDLILLVEVIADLIDLKKSLTDRFKMKELGPLNYCLGISIRQSDGEIQIHQKQYITNMLQRNKIEHETSSPNSPEQNGVAERMNRTLIEKAKAMIVHAGLPKFYWAEAVNTAVYITNRIPTQALDGNITPFEKWYSRKPDLANLKVFGCVAYAHVPKQFRTKLDNKAVKLRFVVYSKGTKGYRLIDESTRRVVTRRVVTRRDVTFDELTFDMTSGRSEQMGNSETASDEAAVEISGQAVAGQNGDVIPAAEPDVVPEAVDAAVPDNTRPVRFRKPMVRYGIDEVYVAKDGAMHEARCAVEMTEPKTMAEALRSPQAKEWKRAAVEEFNSLSEHETWELTELPVNRKTVGCK